MSQTGELARVKARIKALAEKTVANGCTEAEAMAAAEMVGRLLERYALSMDEIEVRSARCVQAEVPLGGRRRRPIDGCVPAIARFCDCKVWLARAARQEPDDLAFDWTSLDSRYVFFGFETDTVLATYLFTVIDRAVLTETAAFKGRNPQLRAVRLRRASASFQHGIVARVAARLEGMHRAREAAVHAQRSTGTSLVPVKSRVVEDAFRDTKIRLMFGCHRRAPARLGVSRGVGGRRPGQSEPPGVGGRTGTARLNGRPDRQRSRVYAWENQVVAPRDPTRVAFPAAQAMVDAIWSDMGLRYPPAVEPLSRQATATVASANRLSIFLPARTPSWCLLHELAHAMTSTAEGHSDGHGAVFMGVYVRLLARYLRLDPTDLIASAHNARIAVAADAARCASIDDRAGACSVYLHAPNGRYGVGPDQTASELSAPR